MNDHSIEIKSIDETTGFSLTTPSDEELPKSYQEIMLEKIIQLEADLKVLQNILLPLHNSGK